MLRFIMRSRILSIYIILVHVFLHLVLLKSDFLDRVEPKFKIWQCQISEEQNFSEYYQRKAKIIERMDAIMPSGAAVFIGDSIMESVFNGAIFVPSMNYSIGGDTTDGVLSRLPKYRSLPRASVVVLAIGINDMATGRDNASIIENCDRILKEIPRGPAIVLSAVLPVAERRLKSYITNERIRSLNRKLEILCINYARCIFVNAGPWLSDKKGFLSNEFCDSDGLHLNRKGNEILIEQLRSVVMQAQQIR
jgi:lysophospholipase L1-like esterase